MNNMNPTIKKAIYISAGVLALVLVSYVFYLGLQSRDKTATIEVQSTVPNDPTVTIDGDKVTSNGKVGVTPGKHTVKAKRSGFDDKSIDVDVKTGETKTVQFLMTPNSDEGRQWLRDHPNEAYQFEGAQGKEFDQTSATITADNPLIAHLPEIHPTWRVDYGQSQKQPDNEKAVAIIITYGNDYAKQSALDWIKSKGFNPDDYEIIYKTPQQNVGG